MYTSWKKEAEICVVSKQKEDVLYTWLGTSVSRYLVEKEVETTYIRTYWYHRAKIFFSLYTFCFPKPLLSFKVCFKLSSANLPRTYLRYSSHMYLFSGVRMSHVEYMYRTEYSAAVSLAFAILTTLLEQHTRSRVRAGPFSFQPYLAGKGVVPTPTYSTRVVMYSTVRTE